jgi:hypothetical protein
MDRNIVIEECAQFLIDEEMDHAAVYADKLRALKTYERDQELAGLRRDITAVRRRLEETNLRIDMAVERVEGRLGRLESYLKTRLDDLSSMLRVLASAMHPGPYPPPSEK